AAVPTEPGRAAEHRRLALRAEGQRHRPRRPAGVRRRDHQRDLPGAQHLSRDRSALRPGMFAPTAIITPTRTPWWWPLRVGWLLLMLWGPVYAAERPMTPPASAPTWEIGEWQFVGVDHMRRALQHRNDVPTPRMLPLAVLPAQRSAWWLGLSASRSGGAQV